MSQSHHPIDSNSNSNSNPNPAADGAAKESQIARYRAAFARLEAEIRAVPTSELTSVNLDVPTAITTVVGSLKEILPLREQIAKVGGVDIDKLDKLRDYADALSHAQGGYRAATAPTDPVTQLAAEVTANRDQLYTDAHALARRGLMDMARVEKLRTPSGHRNIAMDVVGLASLFREHAPTLKNRTAVTEEELEQALHLAQQLMDAVGERDQAPSIVNAASLLRQQAYTLLVNAYDEVRRAITFLRWKEGDADTIAPSLWAGRAVKRVDEASTPNEAPGNPAAATPPGAAPATTNPTASAAPIGVGFPGASPFTS